MTVNNVESEFCVTQYKKKTYKTSVEARPHSDNTRASKGTAAPLCSSVLKEGHSKEDKHRPHTTCTAQDSNACCHTIHYTSRSVTNFHLLHVQTKDGLTR